MLTEINEAVHAIQKHQLPKPQYGIILGTGLGALVNEITVTESIPYEDIPNFPLSTVESHSGKLIFGQLGGKQVVVMQGRFHYYEGYTMKEVTFPVRVLHALGIQKLFISNAAGGLNKSYAIGDLMVLDDHINLMPENPLTGYNYNDLGPRFPDMFEPYSRKLIDQAMAIGNDLPIGVHKGVYAAVTGPNLETRAEYRYLSTIGADAVGMSTVPENIVAVHMGLPCFAISVITDLCYPGVLKPVVIEEVLEAAAGAEPHLTTLITKLIQAQA